MYRPGKDNGCVDALSRNPLPYDGIVIDDELQVARVRKTEELGESHSMMDLKQSSSSHGDFDQEQRKDPDLNTIFKYLEDKELPDEKLAKQIVFRANQFLIDNAILYYVDPKIGSPGKVVVPSHLHHERCL